MVVFEDVWGELIEVVQVRPLKNPPFISNLLWIAYRYPTDNDFRSNLTSNDFRRNLTSYLTLRRLSNATSPNTALTLFSAKFCLSRPLMCLDVHEYPRNENRGEKVKINKNCSASGLPTACSRRSAETQHRAFIRHLQCIAGKTKDFSDLKTNTSDQLCWALFVGVLNAVNR